MTEGKRIFAAGSWVDNLENDVTVANVVLSMDNIKELIRGENVEVANGDFGNALIVIRIEDQKDLL